MLTTLMIGNKIAEARKKINVSQAQLAESLFISSQAVGKWERGESMPDIIMFNRLAEILGVDLNYFSEGTFTASQDTEKYPEKNPESLVKATNGILTVDEKTVTGNDEKKLNWDMSLGNWVDADFSGLKNLHEKFSSSNMQRCLFIGSELSGLLLKSNHVQGCDFSDSDISGSRIKYSHLVSNLFKNCSMKETEFMACHMQGCDFSGADFTGASLKTCDFSKNTVVQTIWNQVSFVASQMTDIVFSGSMENCSFEHCAFSRVTFQDASIKNTFFKNNNLKRIRFVNCTADRITYAFLKSGKSDLTGITLITSPEGK